MRLREGLHDILFSFEGDMQWYLKRAKAKGRADYSGILHQVNTARVAMLSPFAPHIAEEIWQALGHEKSISTAAFPDFDSSHLVENTKEYPISFNGKMRFKLELPLDMSKEDIEKTVLAHERTQAQLQGREPKKVIVVPGKIVNIVG